MMTAMILIWDSTGTWISVDGAGVGRNIGRPQKSPEIFYEYRRRFSTNFSNTRQLKLMHREKDTSLSSIRCVFAVDESKYQMAEMCLFLFQNEII